MNQFRLVLVRTQFAGNLGACARVASNFDLRDTVLVQNFASPLDSEAHRYATHAAREYLDQFKSAPTLKAAVSDCHFAIAFSARQGQTRQATIRPGEIANLCSTGVRVALVFGNEKDGLNSDEVAACSHVCRIPVAEIHPSMNLSHAVAAVIARIYDDVETSASKHKDSLEKNDKDLASTLDELHHVTDELPAFLTKTSFGHKEDVQRAAQQLSHIFARAHVTKSDLALLKRLISND